MIYKRNIAHKHAVKFKNEGSWNNYRILRNRVTAAVTKAKKLHYANLINKAKLNPKEMWKSLRHLLPSKKSTSYIDDINPDEFNTFF